MNNKPNIIIVDDLIEPFLTATEELRVVTAHINAAQEQRVLKSYLLYAYAVFESAIATSYKKILTAFPERIEREQLDFQKHKKEIISNSLIVHLIESICQDFSQKITYGKLTDTFKKYAKTLQVNLVEINITQIQNIKECRNNISHNNTTTNIIDQTTLVKWIGLLQSTLNVLREQIETKYAAFTKLQLVKNSWNYLFSSPLLTFDNHWIIEDGNIVAYNSDAIKKTCQSLSSSEKTFLILFMANYGSIFSSYYSLNDIMGVVSITNKDKIAFITELFSKYPLLLQ